MKSQQLAKLRQQDQYLARAQLSADQERRLRAAMDKHFLGRRAWVGRAFACALGFAVATVAIVGLPLLYEQLSDEAILTRTPASVVLAEYRIESGGASQSAGGCRLRTVAGGLRLSGRCRLRRARGPSITIENADDLALSSEAGRLVITGGRALLHLSGTHSFDVRGLDDLGAPSQGQIRGHDVRLSIGGSTDLQRQFGPPSLGLSWPETSGEFVDTSPVPTERSSAERPTTKLVQPALPGSKTDTTTAPAVQPKKRTSARSAAIRSRGPAKTVKPRPPAVVDGESLVAEVLALRQRGRLQAAAERIDSQLRLRRRWAPGMEALLSHELATIRSQQADRRRGRSDHPHYVTVACRAWQSHLRRFPDSPHRAWVAQELQRLGCVRAVQP